MTRITPNKIEHLKDNEVFVFGSNLKGVHGAGAARTALKWGAITGTGEGLMRQTYALPTKDMKIKTLPILSIKYHVNRFIRFAREHKDLTFLVTEVGCGLAGYAPKDIAPLFKDAIDLENVSLPSSFWKIISKID